MHTSCQCTPWADNICVSLKQTAVVAGCFDIENPCIRNPFVGSHLKYDVCNCRMVRLFYNCIAYSLLGCTLMT